MFSALRQSSLFYILEKGEKPTLKIGQVQSVSNPLPKYGVPSMPTQIGMDTTVDVKVKVGEEVLDFRQLPSNLSIANFGGNGMVVSESREAMNGEIESMLRSSREIVESVDYHRGIITSCEDILRSLNPQLAKEKEQEDKIVSIESKIGGMESSISELKAMLSRALGSNKKGD